jgi:hypothetical protein
MKFDGFGKNTQKSSTVTFMQSAKIFGGRNGNQVANIFALHRDLYGLSVPRSLHMKMAV